MRDPFLVLLGGSIVSVAIWMALTGPGRKDARPRPGTTRVRQSTVHRRWKLAGCIVLAAAGLDLGAYGIGTVSSAGSGITVELGLAMMVLAGGWSIFREQVLRYQLWLGASLYGLPRPAEPAQVKAAEFIGAFLRLLLFLLGLITVLATLILR